MLLLSTSPQPRPLFLRANFCLSRRQGTRLQALAGETRALTTIWTQAKKKCALGLKERVEDELAPAAPAREAVEELRNVEHVKRRSESREEDREGELDEEQQGEAADSEEAIID